MKYCASCGTPHEPHTRFCAGCGTPLGPAPAVLDTGVPAPEDTTGLATTTSASFPDPEPGPARAAPHEHGDDIASASEPTDPILAGSDSVSATTPPAAKNHESRTASFAREGHTGGRVSNPVISCPVCGTIHEEWTPFCETCGAAASPATFSDADLSTVPAEQVAACSQCGHALRSTQLFCTSCGSPNQLAANQSTDQTDTADTANVSSTAASGAGSFERPPARGAPAGTGQQTWEQPQPAWAPPPNERWVPHHQPSLETQSLIGGGLSVPPRASGDAPVDRPDRSRRSLLIASLVMAVLIVAGAAVGIRHLISPSPISKAAGSTAALTSPPPTRPSAPVTPTTPTKHAPITPPPDPQAVAIAALQANRAGDVNSISLTGQWVAQLASKTPGIVDPNQVTARGVHTFTAVDILNEFLKARSNPVYGTYVGLLLSTDYGTRQLYKGQALWVTFAAVPGFSSAADVETWCTQQFPTLSGSLLADFCTPTTLDPPG
jgi:hypothetical protein